MRKIFLDCGAHIGESVRRFQELYPDHEDFQMFCFEPQSEIKRSDVTVIKKAVWIEDGTVDFFPAGVSPAGSTLLRDKTTWKVSKTPIQVPCLDFSRWVARKFNSTDLIVLKLNIEGAEYGVLEKMLADKTLDMIDRLYVSWHFRKIPSISPRRHKRLVANIRAAGHDILKWWS